MHILRRHKEAQARERALARDLWTEKGYVFTSPVGEPLNPNTDYHKWRELLRSATAVSTTPATPWPPSC
ncbi:hypothetical protein [Streptomyces sp. NPDC014734]|uniref:hypothetical protein n=1 Tax=Streptomyces sp. NPDC014734 TaxID=3364886 RepID=UPI003701837E